MHGSQRSPNPAISSLRANGWQHNDASPCGVSIKTDALPALREIFIMAREEYVGEAAAEPAVDGPMPTPLTGAASLLAQAADPGVPVSTFDLFVTAKSIAVVLAALSGGDACARGEEALKQELEDAVAEDPRLSFVRWAATIRAAIFDLRGRSGGLGGRGRGEAAPVEAIQPGKRARRDSTSSSASAGGAGDEETVRAVVAELVEAERIPRTAAEGCAAHGRAGFACGEDAVCVCDEGRGGGAWPESVDPCSSLACGVVWPYEIPTEVAEEAAAVYQRLGSAYVSGYCEAVLRAAFSLGISADNVRYVVTGGTPLGAATPEACRRRNLTMHAQWAECGDPLPLAGVLEAASSADARRAAKRATTDEGAGANGGEVDGFVVVDVPSGTRGIDPSATTVRCSETHAVLCHAVFFWDACLTSSGA